jgi:hypothetical protein
MKKQYLFALFCIATTALYSCGDSTDSKTTANDNTTKQVQPAGTNANDVTIQEIKTAKDIGGKIVDDVAANKRRKDSIRTANATHTWVYQIGEPFEESDLAGKEWDKLNGMTNLYIFKKSRHEYYLIKDDGYPKELLEDSLGGFKKKLAGLETRVAIIDLGSFCSGKKKPSISDPIKYKVDGDKKKIECHECE